jgi:hypothetical protein
VESVAGILAALESHPVAIAAAILICAIAARVLGRAALYASMVVLIILVGAFWTEEFLGWMD